MSSVNKVILVGRVGREPDVRQTSTGLKILNLSLATSKKIRGEEQTQWHRVTMYDKVAEIAAQYVRKGTLLYVEGEIKYGKYTNKDNIEQNTTDIVAYQMQILTRPSVGEEPQRHPEETDDSDVPF